MPTTIDTTPAQSLAITDTNTADTITVSNGPAENGFQTTEVTTATNTTIFANQTAVAISGGSGGDNVVLDNPNPAAGLQELVVANLGGIGSINGGNPNANSPDVAAATLLLAANGSIGNNRALQTQATTLAAAAGTGGAGIIDITNGMSAPVTLNVEILQATNALGGGIDLTNNGTIDASNVGGMILASGLIDITATGASADLDTGSGEMIQSTNGKVALSVGRDINLGDGVGNGSVSAGIGITMTAGRNITLNANATITNSNSGNIFIAAGSAGAGGNITMLTSPGSTSGAPEIVNNVPGGSISLFTGAGGTLTVDSSATYAVRSDDGAINLNADAMVINADIDASGGANVTLATVTPGQAISLGSANARGVLGLSQAELNRIIATALQIGNAGSGNITIASPIAASVGANELALANSGSISENNNAYLSAPGLAVFTTGSVTLDNPNNDIQDFVATAANGVSLVNGTNIVAIASADNESGITTSNSAVSLTADSMLIQAPISAGTGIVTLSAYTSTQNVALGAGNSVGVLGLTNAELADITASVLRIGAVDGNITITGGVTTQTGFNTLSLATGGAIGQTAALSVANLALDANGNISLALSSNVIGTLAFDDTGGAVSFADGSALTIGAVDGLAQSSNLGPSTTLSAAGNMFFASGLSAAGVATLTSTGGAIRDGTNGSMVDVTSLVLAASASTGIGTAAGSFETQVSELNALSSTGGIFINNGNATTATLNIGTGAGGVKATGAGNIVLTNNGAIDSLNSGDVVSGPANVTVKALGAEGDINLGSQASAYSVTNQEGLIDIEAGRDINLGNSTGDGGVSSVNGSINIVAGRNLTMDANGEVTIQTGSGGITVTAGGNITMSIATGTLTTGPEFFTDGGAITLATGTGGTLTVASKGTNAINSSNGNLTLAGDFMTLNQGVDAGFAGDAVIEPVTIGQSIALGTATGGLQLTNAEISEVTAEALTIGNGTAGEVTLAGSVAPGHVKNLTIETGSGFMANTGSSINIGTGVLTIGFDGQGQGASADLRGLTATASAVDVIGGGGNDTIFSGGSGETFTGGGGNDTFEGTAAILNGDTVTDFSAYDKIVISDANPANFAFSVSGNTLRFDPNTAASQTYDTITLSSGANGLLLATADPVAGVNLTDVTPSGTPATPGMTTATMILQNNMSGALDVADLGTNAVLAGYSIGQVGVEWQFGGLGDFSGNEPTDMLMRDANNGALEFFDIANSQITNAVPDGNIGMEWQFVGFGDFSGNANETDMLMRDTGNGQIDYFDIAGNQITAGGTVGNIGMEWQTLGIGDFSTNPNEADLLMRDSSNGQIDYLDIVGNQIVASGALATIGMEWQILGMGDFSGNPNETDMLMRDTNTDQIDYFDIAHNQITAMGLLGNIGMEWQSAGIANVSGNPGESDLLMRDTNNGQIDYFDIAHNQITASGTLGATATTLQPLALV